MLGVLLVLPRALCMDVTRGRAWFLRHVLSMHACKLACSAQPAHGRSSGCMRLVVIGWAGMAERTVEHFGPKFGRQDGHTRAQHGHRCTGACTLEQGCWLLAGGPRYCASVRALGVWPEKQQHSGSTNSIQRCRQDPCSFYWASSLTKRESPAYNNINIHQQFLL